MTTKENPKEQTVEKLSPEFCQGIITKIGCAALDDSRVLGALIIKMQQNSKAYLSGGTFGFMFAPPFSLKDEITEEAGKVLEQHIKDAMGLRTKQQKRSHSGMVLLL